MFVADISIIDSKVAKPVKTNLEGAFFNFFLAEIQKEHSKQLTSFNLLFIKLKEYHIYHKTNIIK